MANIKELTQVTTEMKRLGMKSLHLFLYDVPAEHGWAVAHDPQKAAFARRQRIKIWSVCRAVLSPVQQSVWRVGDHLLKVRTDPSSGAKIPIFGPGQYTFADAVEHWKKEYRANNLPVLMDIVPVGTTGEGYDMFINAEMNTLFKYIASIMKYCTEVEKAQETTKRAYAKKKKERDVLKEQIDRDFGLKSPDWPGSKSTYEKLIATWQEASDRLNDLAKKPIAFEERLAGGEEEGEE